MSFLRITTCLICALFVFTANVEAQRRGQSNDPISFVNDVVPIINAKCGNCHVRSAKGRYDIKSYEALMDSNSVSPNDADDSLFIEVIENGEMPKGGLKVDRNELKILKQWIAEGAKFDGDNESQAINAMGSGAARGSRGNAQSSRGGNRRSSGRRSRRGNSRPNAITGNPLLAFFDSDGNGELSLAEIDAAKRLLYSLDTNEDDRLTQEEVTEFEGR